MASGAILSSEREAPRKRLATFETTSSLATGLELGELDRSEIWRWNKDLPPTTHTCMQDLISDQVRRQPTAQAICSWDGELSYEDIEKYSTLLAYHLLELGLKIGQIVPLCFEKSRWTVVAVLGVMKAGGAFVLMDPSQPFERRQTIAEQVNATLIITSQPHGSLGITIAPGAQAVIVRQDTLLTLAKQTSSSLRPELPVVPTDSSLYLIFTSGSTGKPKGVIIDHATYTTSAITRSTAVGYTAESRVLDFASYAFDVSVDSMLCTLLRGGCLCIPSDEDRLNDLSGVIRRMKITMSNMTPSVARILDPDIVPSLHSLGLGGESCSVGDVSHWGRFTRIVVGYGPSECTVGCTINSSAAGKPYVSIGPGVGAVIWLVDPENHNRLMPVGAIGELLVEGPIVGQGYLGDPEKTAAAFIEDPPWLLAGGGDVPGRRGRLYKTGDLVRYDPDGERGFVFVGRKDTQVKLRGQRVELGEIEHHLRRLLPGTDVMAEVIAPQGRSKESMLLAFVADPNAEKKPDSHNDEPQQAELSIGTREKIANVNEELSKVLPVYMVPSMYVGINRMPMLVSGKTDRKSLRTFGSQLSLQTSSEGGLTSQSQEPVSDAEICLQSIWCRLLGLRAEEVSTAQNFFILGGDSVMAMKLVSAVRVQGFLLTVTDIFNFPVPAFSLIDPTWTRDSACTETAEKCGIDKATIEDIYPCTPLQEILMAFSARSAKSYVAQRIAEIPSMDVAGRLQVAWNTVFMESPILRTRVVEFKDHGFLQVVVNESPRWESRNTSLSSFLEEDQKASMSVNMPLSRYALVHDQSHDKIYFVWTVHHAIYDGWSTDLIVEHAVNAYKGLPLSRPAEFKHFIRYLIDSAREFSKDYWRVQLQDATGPQFPSLPSRMYIPESNALAERFVFVERSTRSGITTATLIRAAWALVASQYTMSDDVVFGETFAGRTLRIPGVEQIEGPMIATVPVRVRIDHSAPVQEFLQAIQEQGLVRAAHEHLGMQNIRRPRRPKTSEPSDDELPSFRAEDAAHEALRFNSYPLMLACSLHDQGFQVTASFDSVLISEPQMNRVLAQLECAVSQLCSEDIAQISSITCLSDQECAGIWQSNTSAVSSAPDTSLLSEEDNSRMIGDKYLTNSVSWIVHPANTNLLMPIGTVGELLLEGVGEAANIETPEWLKQGFGDIPGRHHRLYQTGDLVKYDEDGSLIFMGRKRSLKKVDGHVMDLAAIDIQLRSFLPSTTDVVSQLITPKSDSSQSPVLVAFVSEPPPKDSQVVNLGLETQNAALPLTDVLSTELADSISGLSKDLADILPPYMIPSTYIPLQQVPSLGDQVDVESLKIYTAFSLLGIADVEVFLSHKVQPALADANWSIQDVLPVTDPQARDVEATVSAPRSALQYNMLYLDKTVDIARLLSGRILQVVLESLKVPVSEHSIDEPVDEYCTKLAREDVEQDACFVFGKSFLHIFVVHGIDETGFMIRISHAQYDGISFPEILRQLDEQYQNKPLSPSPPFSTFVQHQADSRIEKINYWRNMLQVSRLTVLPPSQPESKPTFLKRTIDVSARAPDITMATLLTASWARVLAQHLGIGDITFGGVVSGRTVDVPDIDRVMGPCYQVMPLRAKFQAGMTARELLHEMRDQYLKGSHHATLGFQEISDHCTGWSPNIPFFSSIVHHHDIEYFDKMPFAGSECRVDYMNPHPEPPNPIRVVSYSEAGAMYVGIAADKERRGFWQARLEELASAMEAFVQDPAAILA
ncbi:hypothetical protein NUU61_008838 [Penicillium alfredii]|uniref:Carrier domain-containing protein n=1 Tax=Penicillium alfredii TaxID=1506179 RepID=A0A9W9EM57_9EURO|nr:uncharacterized protein NUU61_008838 [Penicillium alfredii]KAJ5084259.1 hypothetical protein NUU61_008838 [Penicillium alfredii]